MAKPRRAITDATRAKLRAGQKRRRLREMREVAFVLYLVAQSVRAGEV